jgi:hypothetical protein
MSSPAPRLLSSVFYTAAPPRATSALVRDAIAPKPAIKPDADTLPQKRRTMIWDLHHTTHCSIVGTCLSTAELRRVLIKLDVGGAKSASDHDLHMLGVMLAGRPESGAKVLQKTLDRRHEPAIKQFARAKDTTALTALWEDALKRGDIPGAYWATLTHPAATEELVKRVFGDIHMLSHLVGAANRADIRRLRVLEEENAALVATLERQQRQLRDGFVERDATIRRLNAALAHAMMRVELPPTEADDYRQIAKDAMADLDKRLSQEIGRRERLEHRVETLQRSLRAAEQAGARAGQRCADHTAELAAIETRIGSLLVAEEDGRTKLDLADATVLYVGGRPNQVPQFKALIERAGGTFLHHDGGIEDSPVLLPGLISRAQWTLFPVDCVSHDAMGAVKRMCQRSNKRYLPLRTSSLTCLYSGLVQLQHGAKPSPSD